MTAIRTAHCGASLLLLLLALPFLALSAAAQNVQGSVADAAGEPLVGVNVFVEGTLIGTTTDANGHFRLDLDFGAGPQTLVFSFLGYERERRVLSAPTAELHVTLREGLLRVRELIVSASRIEERVLEAPVTVQRLTAAQLQAMPSTEVISMLERFKGIDVSRSGLTMSSLSTRGFNSAKAERLIQLVDFVDFQTPSLSLYHGNMGGPDLIDIESIDVIYGANSALYGANAFNGVIIFNTKSPFDHPGVSVRLRGGSSALYSAGDMLDVAARIAHIVTPRLGVKVVGSLMRADEFVANSDAVLTTIAGNIVGVNPDGTFRFRSKDDPRGYVAVNRYGSVDIGPALRATHVGPGLTLGMLGLDGQGAIFTPGFWEVDLVDPGFQAGGGKLNASLYYRITDDILGRYDFRFSTGNGLYQASNRYVFDDVTMDIHSFEVTAPTWSARVYRSNDDAGNAFDLGFLGAFMNRQPYVMGANPTATEAEMNLGGFLRGRNYAEAYAMVYGRAFAMARLRGATVEQALAEAHAAAANVFPRRGEDRFLIARDATLAITTPGQSPRFEVNSQLYHAEGQVIHSAGGFQFALGGSYRLFHLSSNGTLFRDGLNSPIGTEPRDRIPNWEAGSYLQVQRPLLQDRLRISAVGRVDGFQNFDARFSPRISAVFSAGREREHNFRTSFARAHRSPAQLDQHIFLDIGPILLMGNIDGGFQAYDIAETLAFFGGERPTPPELFHIEPLRLEEMSSWEIGYRGLVVPRLFLDVSYYISRYNNFIGTKRFIGREDGSAPSLEEFAALQRGGGPAPGTPEYRNRSRVMQVWLNADQPVTSMGFLIGFEYRVARALTLTGNYTWSHIQEVEDLILGFNTPRHKFNIGVFGEPLANLSYNANLRWAEGYDFHMPFAEGFIESFTTLDAQVSYHFPAFNTRVAIGGTNLLNQNAVSAYGSAPIGRMLYTSLIFSR